MARAPSSTLPSELSPAFQAEWTVPPRKGLVGTRVLAEPAGFAGPVIMIDPPARALLGIARCS
jgi:hypothetical protein